MGMRTPISSVTCIEETYPPDGQIQVGLSKNDQGFYVLSISGFSSPEGDPLVDQVVMDCEEDTVASVATLYEATVLNPLNRDWVDLVIECLLREGVVEPPYDRDDYAHDCCEGGELGGTDEFDACVIDPRPKDEY